MTLEEMVKVVSNGAKRVDFPVRLNGISYNASCYKVQNIIRIDLKPIANPLEGVKQQTELVAVR